MMTVQQLRKMGHTVTVATPVPNAPDDYHGAKVIRVPGFKFPMNEFCDSEYLDIYDSYKIITEFKPDIVHICSPTWIMFGALFWCWWKNIPVVCSYHTHVPEYVKYYGLGFIGTLLSLFLWWLVRIAMNRCDLAIVTSPVMGDELREHKISKEIEVWRKGVDTELFNPNKHSSEMRAKLMPDTSKILLLYAGRMSNEKSLPFLVKVMEDPRLQGKVHLALIGEGPIRKHLEHEAFAHLKDSVSFFDFMKPEQLALAYASSDIFVFPSETETLGLVAIEAMAGGLPVVGVNARGMKITVKHGETGFKYEPGDVNQCVSFLVSLIDNPALRNTLKKNARLDAEEWSWEKATQHIVELYNRTIKKVHTKNE